MSGLAERFQKYKKSPVALYGLGIETQKVIAGLENEFHIVGLLDSFREEGTAYGRQIISLDECKKKGVRLIIVIARPGSCRAIFKRIGSFCSKNEIVVMDVRGKRLCDHGNVIYDLKSMKSITRKQVLDLVSEAEIISFDLFDTLIMRKVLYAADVISLTAYRLKQKGILIDQFYKKRLQAEKELARCGAPSLVQIYKSVLDNSLPCNISAEELAELEWSVDCSLLVPRDDSAELMSQIFNTGKRVYIVTDTYYKKDQIIKLMEQLGIRGYTDILASCEYGTGKEQQLFSVLKNREKGKKYLHIGDDPAADILSAKKNGIDSCQLYSGLDFLEGTGYFGLWEQLDDLPARIRAGMFAARLFNSPFQFESEDKSICIRNDYDLGYLFMAPLISDFTIWFDRRTAGEKIKNIWFGSRDGYLIRQLYDRMGRDIHSVYFLTSRVAAIRAGMKNSKDLAYVSGMKYSGTLQQQLKERFGIIVQESDAEGGRLSDYEPVILSEADRQRQNYKRYIDTLRMEEGDIAFFDFVAKGTTQMYVERLAGRHMKGFYFLQLEKEYMSDKGLDIEAFYDNDGEKNSKIYEDYYILETVLTSEEASVKGFDESGNVIYSDEVRSCEEIACIKNVQKGILDYFQDYIRICPDPEAGINQKMDEIFLDMLHRFTLCGKFRNLSVEDAFFNRTTGIADLI